jgi:hypothetical protein
MMRAEPSKPLSASIVTSSDRTTEKLHFDTSSATTMTEMPISAFCASRVSY